MNSEQQVHRKLPDASVEGSGPVPSPDASELAPTTGTSAEDKAEIAIPAIEFRNVNFSYEDKKVLDDLSFQLAKGETASRLSSSQTTSTSHNSFPSLPWGLA